ncbi:MAG: hypothetical protein HC918_12385, partial [Oscillatoriales cyanobacterium SM2_1_8]|nr:hypothetical protein [Oscillatoriales cyanobacterium SM2_1_8]
MANGYRQPAKRRWWGLLWAALCWLALILTLAPWWRWCCLWRSGASIV